MRVVLISTYDLGHQPFGLASPASWLRAAGAEVACFDLAVQPFAEAAAELSAAALVAFYLPMHTATRLATAVLPRVKRLNPGAHLCAYGLYAALNGAHLRSLGVHTVLGGEFEQQLVALCASLRDGSPATLPQVSLARQQFQMPDRTGLPPLARYARLQMGAHSHVAGYTVASRGCKHSCRHCPVVPVYNGRFRIVQQEVVLADIRAQVAAGARHVTFGDPDFFNGPGHAIPLVEAMHREFPDLTYDVTIKVAHLLAHARYLSLLRRTGCLFVTTAVEAVQDDVLQIFQKGHTRADFERVVRLCREAGLPLNPTFVSFTPWTTPTGYVELLAAIDQLELVDHVAPIQYAIRLLVPAESRLLDLPEARACFQPFDAEALVYPWKHPDPRMDALYETVFSLVKLNQRTGESRRVHFERVWQAAVALLEGDAIPARAHPAAERAVPTLSEDWY